MADNSQFRANRVQALLKQGKPTLGTWLSISSCSSAEAMSYVGFDWLVIDMEHSAHSFEGAENMIRTIERTDVVPFVRVAWNDPVLMKLALDRGAMGIVVPWVNSKAEAEMAVRGCMFPPKGLRGVGGGRTTKYDMDEGKYMREANDNILVIVQIETQAAIDNIEEILSVEGVGAAFIGPYDLTSSMGIPGQFKNPRFEEAVQKVLAAGKSHNVPVGMYLGSPEIVAERIGQGFQLVAMTSEIGHMVNGAKQAIARVESICGVKMGPGRDK